MIFNILLYAKNIHIFKPFESLNIEYTNNSIKLNTNDNLIKSFVLDSPERLVFDFEKKDYFKTITKKISGLFSKIVIGSHDKYYRVVLYVDHKNSTDFSININKNNIYITQKFINSINIIKPSKTKILKYNNKKAYILLEDKYIDAAFIKLENMYESNQYNSQTLFLLASAASKIEHYDYAANILKLILEKEPSNKRVQVELAKVYFLNNNISESKKLFIKIKNDKKTPETVKNNISKYLLAIEEKEELINQFSISLGYLYDTNVNSGITTDKIPFNNNGQILYATADDNMKPKSDSAIVTTFSFNHKNHINSYSYINSLIYISKTNYKKLDTSDMQIINLQSSYLTKNKVINLNIPFAITKLTTKSTFYFDEYSLKPSIAYKLNHQNIGQLGLEYSKKYFSTDETSVIYCITPSIIHLFLNGGMLNNAISYKREKFHDNTKSNSINNISITYQKDLKDKYTFKAYISRQWTKYDAKKATSVALQEDILDVYSLALDKGFSYDANVSFEYTKIKQNSSIPTSVFEKEQVKIIFNKSF
jgi:hypothetical protein